MSYAHFGPAITVAVSEISTGGYLLVVRARVTERFEHNWNKAVAWALARDHSFEDYQGDEPTTATAGVEVHLLVPIDKETV